MSNMSYCRFQNTLRDLRDCQKALYDGVDVLEGDEWRAAMALFHVCEQIVYEFKEDFNDD